MAQQRTDPRFMCAELVNILIHHEGTMEEAIASLEDISRSGACVQLEKAIRVGADIEIVCSKCSFRGKVRNCRYAATGYDVGVAFDHAHAWDPAQFEPAHLLPIATAAHDCAEHGAESRIMAAGASPD